MRKGPARSWTFLVDMKYGPSKTDTPPEFSLRNEHAEVSRQTKTQKRTGGSFLGHEACYLLSLSDATSVVQPNGSGSVPF